MRFDFRGGSYSVCMTRTLRNSRISAVITDSEFGKLTTVVESIIRLDEDRN